MNGDFLPDLLVGDGSNSEIWVYIGLGGAAFREPRRFPGPTSTPLVVTGDFNGDGRLDISDGVGLLGFLFLGGPAHPLAAAGTETETCILVSGCPESEGCTGARRAQAAAPGLPENH